MYLYILSFIQEFLGINLLLSTGFKAPLTGPMGTVKIAVLLLSLGRSHSPLPSENGPNHFSKNVIFVDWDHQE